MKSFPQDQGRHFRDYVPSSATWIDPKTIRHSLSGTLFSQNNQSKRKQLKKHVRRSQKSREWFLFLSMFVLCKKPSRPIAKHNILTDISLSFCIVRFPSPIFFFIFFSFPFRRKLDVFGSSNNIKYVCTVLSLCSKVELYLFTFVCFGDLSFSSYLGLD